MMKRFFAALVVVSVFGSFAASTSAQPAPDFSAADAAINDAIAKKNCPGAVLVVGRTSGVIYEKAYGNRAVQPAAEAMTADTIFDCASLSKPVGTNTSVMILIDRGQIDPKAKVAQYLPEFGKNGKEEITVE